MRKMSLGFYLLLITMSVGGCATQSEEATLLEVPDDAKAVQYINSNDGRISELIYKVSNEKNDNGSGAAMFDQFQQQGFTPCTKNTSKWVRVSSIDQNKSENNHRFIWFLKMEGEQTLATIAIDQTCTEGKDQCDQSISTRITRFPWWMLTRSINIKDICG